MDALEKACESYKVCKSLYQAAKQLEQAVLICRDSDRCYNCFNLIIRIHDTKYKEVSYNETCFYRLDQIANYAERGGLLYRQHGSPESAAQLLEKAAKILESKKPDQALELYQKAAETIMVEDRPKQAADYMTKVARLQVICTYKSF